MSEAASWNSSQRHQAKCKLHNSVWFILQNWRFKEVMSGSVFHSKTGEDHPNHSLSLSSQYMKVLFDIPKMKAEGQTEFHAKSHFFCTRLRKSSGYPLVKWLSWMHRLRLSESSWESCWGKSCLGLRNCQPRNIRSFGKPSLLPPPQAFNSQAFGYVAVSLTICWPVAQEEVGTPGQGCGG